MTFAEVAFAQPSTLNSQNHKLQASSPTVSSLRAVSAVAADARSSHSGGLCTAATVAGVAALSLSVNQRQRRSARQSAGTHRGPVALRAGKQIETFLVQGPIDAGKLAMAIAPLAAHIDMSCLAFFSLGVSPDLIASVAGGSLGIHGMCPVYIADCYGIVGWDKKAGKNIELMELGRGQEYGMAGGQGGEGVVVVAFRGASHTPSEEATASSGLNMVVAAHGKVDLGACPGGTSWGGYAKACYKLEHSGDVVEVERFVVSSNTAAAVSSFDGDAGEATSSTSGALSGAPVAAGYIPCFCRGFNKYGKDGVEPEAMAISGLEGVPLFGMFAHGELGPEKGAPVTRTTSDGEASSPSHAVHSSTSVLAVYGS
eukprot:TRINITY_DN43185_c0_g1_i1.p1 TRINITY_DN43185_c0_g1~~TRINITY_DN43185_c0_g1_i1.p1  ORF type:complete len:370 (-),score=84.38 TRINITY_DN43185_c0_g1_i1:127-1236(-)